MASETAIPVVHRGGPQDGLSGYCIGRDDELITLIHPRTRPGDWLYQYQGSTDTSGRRVLVWSQWSGEGESDGRD